jgi:hypothetical protein
MYSLVMVTVKVSSPREQEYLALQVSSVLSADYKVTAKKPENPKYTLRIRIL